MATTTVTYSPAAGRQFVDLTSWAGDASFATTPVAGDQIEAVDTLTLNSDGSVSGSDGSYTLRHVRAANGTVEALNYDIGTVVPPETASATVTYSPAIGRQVVTLTGWTGDAAFSATPASGDQIESPSGLTVSASGEVTGSDGTYTLRLIDGDTGASEALSYTIGTQDNTAPILSGLSATGTDPDTIDVSVSTDEGNGTLYVFASANATEDRPTVKASAQGIQVISATGTQSIALTLSTGSYYVHAMHEDAESNQSDVVSSNQVTLSAVVEPEESASTTVTYAVPDGKALTTLESPIEQYLFEDWPTAPSAGEQLISDGQFDVNGNWAGDTEGVIPVWFVASVGTLYGLTVDTTGLESAVDTTPDQFSLGADVTGAEPGANTQRSFVLSGIEAGETVSVTATGDATATPSTAENGDTITVELTAGIFEAVVSGGVSIGGVSDSFSVTSRAAVLPTLDVTLPDLSLGETDTGSIDLDDYFSGASSYTLTGIPSGSGFSFAGSVLSWNTNKDDIAASPFTLTATAISADGSINDAFSVTVVDDIGPNISVYPLTTMDTSPIVSGSAGDAVSLTLVVTGVGTYNPTPSGGAWSQQLPTLALGDYTMTLNGEDASGNQAIQKTATLRVVEEIVNDVKSLRKSLHGKLRLSLKMS